MTPLTPHRARQVFLLLTLTRWFPVGLVVTVTTLLPIERGLSVPETLTALSLTGFVVFALELPTAGLADSLGRRPMLVAAAVLQVAAAALFLSAQTFWAFALAAAVTGIFRALDSGPLESWFVDTVHATEPGADVDRPLAAQGTVLGVAIAAGALISGGLVWWHPLDAWSSLVLPYAVYAALSIVHLVAVIALVRETPRNAAHPSGADDAAHVADAATDAGAAGPGATPALPPAPSSGTRGGSGVAARVRGSARQPQAVADHPGRLARVLNGLGAVWMGLALGPVGLIAAYLVTYGLHGACGPAYQALLHREAESRNRTTVLSMASMVGFAAYSLGAPALGWAAGLLSIPAAMVIGGVFSTVGALCFLPALRRERQLSGRTPRLSGTLAR